MSEKLVGKAVLKRHEVAKPVHIQRLEAALDVRPFICQVEKILNSDGTSETDDDSDKSMINEMSKGDRLVHGVVTSKQGICIFCKNKTKLYFTVHYIVPRSIILMKLC